MESKNDGSRDHRAVSPEPPDQQAWLLPDLLPETNRAALAKVEELLVGVVADPLGAAIAHDVLVCGLVLERRGPEIVSVDPDGPAGIRVVGISATLAAGALRVAIVPVVTDLVRQSPGAARQVVPSDRDGISDPPKSGHAGAIGDVDDAEVVAAAAVGGALGRDLVENLVPSRAVGQKVRRAVQGRVNLRVIVGDRMEPADVVHERGRVARH